MNMELVALICFSLAYVTVGFLCYRRPESDREETISDIMAEQDRRYLTILDEIQNLKEEIKDLKDKN